MSDCEYCHTDKDGYIKPLEKNGHAYLYPSAYGYKLYVTSLRGDRKECAVNYCPMCGRKLRESDA